MELDDDIKLARPAVGCENGTSHLLKRRFELFLALTRSYFNVYIRPLPDHNGGITKDCEEEASSSTVHGTDPTTGTETNFANYSLFLVACLPH